MWFFNSPRIIFGEDSLSWLSQLSGKRAFVVTDAVMQQLGYLERVEQQLELAGIVIQTFSEVEPDPSLETVERCAGQMHAFAPDWIIGLGGGSSMDAAKAAWFRYERPDIPLEAVNPMEFFGLGAKARLITIPTTAGSGAEVTTAAVITDTAARRKLEVASYELVPSIAIVDPQFSSHMPAPLTADTGIDVLTHSVEGYSSTWNNDFSDGLCLLATQMVFEYLPRAVAKGAADPVAREKMANAATIGALGMGNSHIALAHALGHSIGTLFHLPHGRVTGLMLPYTIEYNAQGGLGRYTGLARILNLPYENELQAGMALAAATRRLLSEIEQPTCLEQLGISRETFQSSLDDLCERAQLDSAIVTARRVPDWQELQRLFEYTFSGKVIDF